jgi:hypothetical protein
MLMADPYWLHRREDVEVSAEVAARGVRARRGWGVRRSAGEWVVPRAAAMAVRERVAGDMLADDQRDPHDPTVPVERLGERNAVRVSAAVGVLRDVEVAVVALR